MNEKKPDMSMYKNLSMNNLIFKCNTETRDASLCINGDNELLRFNLDDFLKLNDLIQKSLSKQEKQYKPFELNSVIKHIGKSIYSDENKNYKYKIIGINSEDVLIANEINHYFIINPNGLLKYRFCCNDEICGIKLKKDSECFYPITIEIDGKKYKSVNDDTDHCYECAFANRECPFSTDLCIDRDICFKEVEE